MSILTDIENMITYLPKTHQSKVVLIWLSLILIIMAGCEKPKERIVLRQIRDVVVDANDNPTLKANAIFFNPNDVRGKLKRINVIVYVNGKKAAHVDQKLKTLIPAKGEFSVPLEINLSIKELGFMDTLLGVLGGKKFDVRYEGTLKLTYHGIPINVPVDYKDEVRIRF
ncbi:MAG: LEA type 2 family protein [Chryseolinea sp.]